MKIQRKLSAPERDLSAAMEEVLRQAEKEYPEATVSIHAYYGGTFYVEVRRPGQKVAEVIAR